MMLEFMNAHYVACNKRQHKISEKLPRHFKMNKLGNIFIVYVWVFPQFAMSSSLCPQQSLSLLTPLSIWGDEPHFHLRHVVPQPASFPFEHEGETQPERPPVTIQPPKHHHWLKYSFRYSRLGFIGGRSLPLCAKAHWGCVFENYLGFGILQRAEGLV